MERVRIRANANLTDLAVGQEVEVDLDRRTQRRVDNGLVSIVEFVVYEPVGDGLDDLSYDDLVAIARDVDLPGRSTMSKAQLVDALRASAQRTPGEDDGPDVLTTGDG
jgi:hypothetical protein